MKNKIFALFLTTCLCFQIPGVVYGSSLFDNFGVSELAVDFKQNYDNINENESLINSGWSSKQKSVEMKVVSDPENADNKYGYILSNEGGTIVDNVFSPISGSKIIVGYKIKVNDINSRQVVTMHGIKKQDGSRAEALIIGYNDAGNVAVNNSSTITKYEVGKWYSYSILIDTKNDVLNLYRDGALISEGKAMRNAVSAVSSLRFYIKNKGSDICFDDIKIGVVNEDETSAKKEIASKNTLENYALPPEMAAWTEEDKKQQRLAAVEMMDNLRQSIANGEKEIVVPPGYYRVGNSEIQTFGLYGAKDVTILGYGAEIIREGIDDATEFFFCERVSFKGFTIDFDPLPFTQMEILRIDKENKFFEVKQEPGFMDINIFIKSWNSGARCSIYDKSRTRQKPTTNREVVSRAELIGDNIFRVYFRDNYYFRYDYDINPGDILVSSKRNNGRAMSVISCESMIFEDINIYASSAFTIAEVSGKGGNVYRRIKEVRRPGTKRLFVGAADGFNSSGVEKGPTLEQCEISNIADDYVNVHGDWAFVYKQISPTKIIYGKAGIRSIDVGSDVEFYNIENLNRIGKAKVTKIEPIYNEILTQNIQRLPEIARSESSRAGIFGQDSYRGYILELDTPVEVKVGDIVNCETYSGKGTVIRDCYFHDGLVRGILITTSDMLIENNRFERTGGPAILILSEVYYLAGPFPHSITVKNNTIIESNMNQRGRYDNPGAITIYNTPYINNSGLYRSIQSYNIKIIDNVIKDSAVGGIFGANLRNSLIEGNVIENVYMWQPDKRIGNEIGVSEPFYAIYFTAAEDIEIKNNVFKSLSNYNYGEIGVGKYTKNISITK